GWQKIAAFLFLWHLCRRECPLCAALRGRGAGGGGVPSASGEGRGRGRTEPARAARQSGAVPHGNLPLLCRPSGRGIAAVPGMAPRGPRGHAGGRRFDPGGAPEGAAAALDLAAGRGSMWGRARARRLRRRPARGAPAARGRQGKPPRLVQLPLHAVPDRASGGHPGPHSGRVGASVLIGALGATPVLALAAVLLWRLPRAARAVQAQADLRMSLLKEVLGAPRTPGASRPPEAGLVAARAQELARLTALLVMAGCLGAVVFALPRLIVCCTLSVHAQLAGDVSARTIFVCMQVVANLKHLVDSSATRARRLPALLVSLRRIEVFLLAPEALPQRLLQDGPAPQGGQPSAAVRLRGSFSRCPDQPAALHRLELDVERGARVAVVGDAGSGKTSLLLAMLGELHPAPGAEATLACGRAAHCAAPPWLLRGSLQDNVLCGAPLEEGRYHAALAAAGLTPGSEGAAPAYGARVSIARAVYSRAGVVLVDDGLLGAAGAAAGRRAWERLLADPLMRGRACVAVVPADDQLAAAFEEVLVLSHGRVVAHGTPNAVVPSQEFRRLPRPPGPLGNSPAAGLAPGALAAVPGGPERADWQTWRFFLRSGQRGHLAAALALQALARAFSALGDVQLANWASSRAVPRGSHADSAHVLGYGLWLLGATLCFLGSCVFLARFSSTVAGGVFREVLAGPLPGRQPGPWSGAAGSQEGGYAGPVRGPGAAGKGDGWWLKPATTSLVRVRLRHRAGVRPLLHALEVHGHSPAVLCRPGADGRALLQDVGAAAPPGAAAVSARSLGAAALLDADFAARAAEQLKAQFLART
ncbi:unnamed protein product, partial [Prorocentrum cordatum]